MKFDPTDRKTEPSNNRNSCVDVFLTLVTRYYNRNASADISTASLERPSETDAIGCN